MAHWLANNGSYPQQTASKGREYLIDLAIVVSCGLLFPQDL
jgi:hypothetical protein